MPNRSTSFARRLAAALLGLAAFFVLCLPASAQQGGGQYLDADHCTDTLNLNPGSDFDNGSCQLWLLVPGPEGWSRLQLKRNGKFLDAKFCTDELNMNPGSNFDGGSCQLWKLVADTVAEGWSRIQIKRNGKYLTAANCTDIVLSELVTGDASATQLWKFVPDENAGGGWARLQIKCAGGSAPVVAGSDEYTYNGDTYGWYDDGWNGGGWYIIGCEFRRGFCFGGREGWRGWKHRGSHPHRAGGEHPTVEHRGIEHRQIPIPGNRQVPTVHHPRSVPTVHHPRSVPTVHHPRSVVHVGGTHVSGGRRGGGGGGGGHRRSDIRLKHDIVLLGHLDNGLGFYRFSYNGSDKVYVGVMAQEVQTVMPAAVARGSDGYLLVDYDRLGIRMQTWNAWVAAGERIPTATSIRH